MSYTEILNFEEMKDFKWMTLDSYNKVMKVEGKRID